MRLGRRQGLRQNLPMSNRLRPARSSAFDEFRLDVELRIIAEMERGESRHREVRHLDCDSGQGRPGDAVFHDSLPRLGML